MKRIILILFFCCFYKNALSNVNLAYLDVQFIIDNSNLGKFYKSEIKKIQDSYEPDLISKQKEIKKKEDELNNQKNLLNQDELTNKINEIKKLISEYQKFNNEVSKEISIKKKKFSNEILVILNPLLTEYVDNKNINLVIEKKNVLVGVKSLDITNDILKTFNDKTKKMKKIDEN